MAVDQRSAFHARNYWNPCPVVSLMIEARAPFIVVALAGLVRPIQVRARKLFTHCGVTIIEIPCVPDDLEMMRRKVRLDAVVIDARSLLGSVEPVPQFVDLIASSCTVSADVAPMSVLVLGNRYVPRWVRPLCKQHGARFLSVRTKQSNYPELIRILREMRGIETECCSPLRSGVEARR